MTLHKLTAGDGYTYLTRQVAVVDSTERGRAGLADYYTERGESPGRWVGSALADVDLAVGDVVTEAQMLALFGEGRHPNADQLVEDAIRAAVNRCCRGRCRRSWRPGSGGRGGDHGEHPVGATVPGARCRAAIPGPGRASGGGGEPGPGGAPGHPDGRGGAGRDPHPGRAGDCSPPRTGATRSTRGNCPRSSPPRTGPRPRRWPGMT